MTRGAELERVRHEGKRVRTASMDVRATASLLAFPRVGFVVPRYKHSAVARNLVKRRLREVVRRFVLPELPAMDLVVRVQPAAYGRTFEALQTELVSAVRRLVRDLGADARPPGPPLGPPVSPPVAPPVA